MKEILEYLFNHHTLSKSEAKAIMIEIAQNRFNSAEVTAFISVFLMRNITLEELEPNPKNPVIANFFRNIGYADQLGSGVRNLFKYSRLYSGEDPEFIEGDIFKIIVPLNEKYSFDYYSKFFYSFSRF